MRVRTIQIKAFRCFDSAGQTITLDRLTCLVGPNASGKTAVMMALARMFSDNQSERAIRPSDFHLAAGEELTSARERHLSIESRLVFPELEHEKTVGRAVPETFNQMVVDEPGATPYCRIRLEATWVNDGTPSGDLRQDLWWILTASDDPEVIEGNRRRVSPAERARIRVVYVPAARDSSAHVRFSSATAFGRLLRALEWGGKDDALRQRLLDLKSELGQLRGVETMNAQLQAAWSGLYDGQVAARVAFESIDEDPSALLELLVPTFAPDEGGQQLRSTDLSDGLRSLFALSLPLGLFRVEGLLMTAAASAGFRESVADDLPLLTFFAVEEPENHLSPHYLGKVVRQLSDVANAAGAQVVLSSHSPSIMGRIQPDWVRYFLGGENRPSTEVRSLDLPKDSTDESFKYVREAVRGYPELYFSRLVVLGEGPSEEIVLRALFEKSGTPLDSQFISVVPLGGRHVNHFWRLLHGLGIPFITLLDLDREKEGAGWGRVQYVRDQLVSLYGATSARLVLTGPSGPEMTLADACHDSLHANDDRADVEEMNAWLLYFREQFGVYFSVPLDLDFSMLESFSETYRGQAPAGGGPRLPAADPERSEALRNRMRQVLAADTAKAPPDLGSSYGATQLDLFAWYKYLFVDGSKPVAHMRALVALDDTKWVESAPETLRVLLQHAQQLGGRDAPPAP